MSQILCMVTLSYLCGQVGYRPVARFCKNHSDSLSEILSLGHGVPSHVTFREVLLHVDQNSLINAFNQWAMESVSFTKGAWISAVGKALGSTVKDHHGPGQDYQAVVSLFVQQSGLVYSIAEYHNKELIPRHTAVVV